MVNMVNMLNNRIPPKVIIHCRILPSQESSFSSAIGIDKAAGSVEVELTAAGKLLKPKSRERIFNKNLPIGLAITLRI